MNQWKNIKGINKPNQKFKEVEFIQLSRSQNHQADALSKFSRFCLTKLNMLVMVEVWPFKAF